MGNDCENANTHTLGGVGTFTKEVVFAGVRWVWVPLSLPPSLRIRENGFGAFGKMECLFSIAPDANSWWLAHWSKGEEVRSENKLVAKMLASVN